MASQVQLGRSTDYSQVPPVQVITLDQRWGSLLISALAILVTMAGAAFWSVLALILHQVRSDGEPHDTLFFQVSILLRNQPGAVGTAMKLFSLLWAWRKNPPKNAFGRLLRLAMIPLIVSLAFSAAGIFVGKVTSPPDQINNVLALADSCGIALPNEDPESYYYYSSKIVNDSIAASVYADKCYHTPTGTIGCSQLPIQKLNYSQEVISNCPFGGINRCLTPPIQLTSDPIDSNLQLGINAPASDSVSMITRRTCAPLSVRSNYVVLNDPASDPRTGFVLIAFTLGPIVDSTSIISNYTYIYLSREVNSSIAYTVQSFQNYADSNDSAWAAIPDFALPNADTTIHFIAANAVEYLNPVTGPIFSANGTTTDTLPSGQILYNPDQIVNVLGCIDQYQFCNSSSNNSCNPFLGWEQSIVATNMSGYNDAQKAAIERLFRTVELASSYHIIAGQGGSALQASKLVFGLLSPGVPANQWMNEVTHWYETSLASIQARVAEYATNSWKRVNQNQAGIRVSPPSEWAEPETKSYLEDMCNQQRIRSTSQYINFSFLGVVIVVSISSFFILLSWILESLLDIFAGKPPSENTNEDVLVENGMAQPGITGQDTKRKPRPRAVARVADTMFSLHRMAMEAKGQRDWVRTDATPSRKITRDAVDSVLIVGPKENSSGVEYYMVDPGKRFAI